MFRHDLSKPLRGILLVRIERGMVHRLSALALDDKAVKAVRLKKFFYDIVCRAVAHETDLHLKILFRLKKLALDMEDTLHADDNNGRPRGNDVHPRARSHPDARRRPHARGGRQTMDLVLAVDDDAGAQKADARDDLRRHARSIRLDRIANPYLETTMMSADPAHTMVCVRMPASL